MPHFVTIRILIKKNQTKTFQKAFTLYNFRSKNSIVEYQLNRITLNASIEYQGYKCYKYQDLCGQFLMTK